MTNTKDVIQKLKEVKKEKDLSLDKIVSLMEQNGEYVSKTTLSRVFSDGSEEKTFRYDTTLRPIANALLDIENFEPDDDTDTKAYKSILKLKKELIEELKAELVTEKSKYQEKLLKETERFQKSLDFAMHQIELKDQRITQLLDANIQLLNKLL